MTRVFRSLRSWVQALNPNRSFKTKLALTIGSVTCVLLLLVNAVAGHIMTQQLQAEIGQSLLNTAHQMAIDLDRGMFERYREIQLVARERLLQDPTTDPAIKRSILETLQSTYPYYAWLGIANLEGEVVVATGGLLEGKNISDRPVFQGGKTQPFVGDVHDAKLLARHIARDPQTDEPLRLLDIAAPIKNEQDAVVGVLASHLSWTWIEELERSLLHPQGKNPQLDLLILNKKGKVLSGSGATPGVLDAETAQEMGDGQDDYRIMTAADGQQYLVGHSHTSGYRDYKGLGWVTLLSQPVDQAFAPVYQMQRRLLLVAGLGGVLVAGLSGLLASLLTRPIAQLARAADRLSHDRSNAPFPILPGENEVARLSRSLHDLLQQRQQLNTILQQQEDSYRLLFEASPLPMWVIDRETMRFLAVNEAAIQHYGYTEAEWLSMALADIRPPEDIPRLTEHIENRPLGYVKAGIFRHVKRDGSLILMEITSNTFTFRDRPCWFTVGNDVTEREQMQSAVQEREQTLKLFFQYVPTGVIMLDRELRYLYASRRWIEDYGLESLESVIGLSHYELFPELPDEWKQIHQRCLAGAIERNDEEVFVRADGSQQWVRWEVRPWYRTDQMIGGIIIFAEEITDRKQAEIALRESEARYANLAAAAPVGIFRTDLLGHGIYHNDRWCELTGLRPEQGNRSGWKSIIHPDDLAQLEATWITCLQTQTPFKMEYRLCRPDGSVIWVIGQVVAERQQDGQITGHVGTLTDITDLKLAEIRLRESEANYASLTDVAPVGIFRTDALGQCVYVNDRWCELAGFGREQALGWGWAEALHPDDHISVAWNEAAQTQTLFRMEYRFLRPDGTVSWVFGQATAECDENGQVIGYVGTITDITDRKRAEESLRLSEERYRSLVQTTTNCVWITDAEGKAIYAGPNWTELTGQTLNSDPDWNWLEMMHPDDRDLIAQVFGRCLATGELYELEYRVLAQTGEWRWFFAKGVPVYNLDGTIREWVGTLTDTTDRRVAETALRENEQRLRAVLQSMPVMLDVFDAAGNIVLWNQECERVTGFTAAEVINNPAILQRLYPDPLYREQMLRAWAERGNNYRNWEWEMTAKDGSTRTIAWSNIADHFPIPGWANWGIGVDVTDRSRAETALQESNARLEAMFQAFPDLFFRVGADGTILEHQTSQTSDLYVPPEVFLGKRMQDILPAPANQQTYEAVQRSLATSAVVTVEYSLPLPQGDTTFEGRLVRFQPDQVIFIARNITDRREAEAALRLSEERFRAAFEQAGVGITIVDTHTSRHIQVNQKVCDLLGYTEAELQQLTWQEVTHPDDLEADRALDAPVITGESSGFMMEKRYLKKDGTPHWISLSIALVRDADGMPQHKVGVLQDIHDRKLAEAALQESEAFNRLLFEQFPIGLAVCRMDGQLTYVNSAYANMLGRTVEETLLLTYWEITPETYASQEAEQLHSLETTGRYGPYEKEYIHKDGHRVPVLLTGLILEQGGESLIWSSVQDISDRKRAETALQQAEAQLRQANQELERRVEERTAELQQASDRLRQELTKRQIVEEQLRRSYNRISHANSELARASRMKDEFLANMSHELRTPLNAVLGLSEALLEEVYGNLTAQQRLSLSTIESSGKHLLGLINDILDLSKIESGRMELYLTLNAVRDICDSSLLFVRQLAHQKSLQLRLQLPDQIEAALLDAGRLRQALINLLSNAVKFTPDGGEVRLEVEAVDEVIKFHIVDTGIGIAADQMSKLFQPFVQLESSLSRRYAGTGLGLALVRRIAELHGGSVALESEVGAGSRFTIALPYTQTPPPDSPRLTPQSPLPTPDSLTRVLIIEDEPAAAEQLSRYLEELGVDAIVFPDCRTVVEAVLQAQPDLILLDILLPDCSGWDALALLKADSRTAAIPVLIISVVDEPSQAAQLGAAGYLVKPISRAQFHMALHQLSNPLASEASPMSTQHALILLAEDNEANITMMLPYLEAHHYQVIVARNGIEAVRSAKDDTPDLILMDVQMPEMDGLEAIRQIRQTPTLKETPIIALTALAIPGDRDRCLAAGANDYLPKPVSLKQLRQMLDQYIGGRG